MVHVEIFLGGPTGEQTIGARWNNGVVSIFDSYKFVSKTYYDIKFHFRSIDTWLQGVCKYQGKLLIFFKVKLGVSVMSITGWRIETSLREIDSLFSRMKVFLLS